ncbi:S8 family peptidase [Sporosarcina sp. SAFN-015]|uniref:S8 family peptidase n=1 Tax=Sporosarcina sp. SAFN-015 TaxID=3387274 RepID=UPI003F80E303
MNRLLSYFLPIALLSMLLHPDGVFAEGQKVDDFEYIPDPIETGDVIVKVIDRFGNYEYEAIPEAEYTQLKALESTNPYRISPFPRIEFVQKEYIRYVDPFQSNNPPLSWGPDRIGSSVLANSISGSNEIIVAVVDSGVDYNHPFLKNRMVRGYDFVSNDSDPMDVHGHGTHVSGIVVDSTSDNVKIMPIRVLDGQGRGSDLNISKGIRYAVDHGAHVINMSLGGPGPSPMMKEAIEYAVNKGVQVVVAAGNNKADTKHYYPASDEKAIVVAATNQNDQPAYFSNFGTSIDIAAPGESINSSIIGGGYGVQSGTSMAAPFVSGVTALLLSVNSEASKEDIEDLLFMYTDDKWQTGRDIYYGEGIINITNYVTSTEPLSVISPNAYSQQAEKVELKVILENAVGKTLYVKIGGQQLAQRKVTQNGFQALTVPFDKIESGNYTMEVGIDNGQIHKQIPITITNHTNQFSIKDTGGSSDTSFEIIIYGIKDGEVVNENLHPTATPLYHSGSIGDTAVIDGMDVNELKEKLDYIVAVAKSANRDTPLYVRELVTNGNHMFEPTTIQKIAFENKLSASNPNAMYKNNIQLSFKGTLLPKTLLFMTPNSEQLVMYVERGNHLVNFFSEDFFYSEFTGNEKELNLAVTEQNTFEYNFISNSDGVGADGFMAGDYAYLRLYMSLDPFIEVGDQALEQGSNTFRIKKGDYRALLSHYVKDKRELVVFRDINEQTALRNSVFNYGGTIKGEFLINYLADGLSGKILYKDGFGNTLYTNSGYYDYLGYAMEQGEFQPAFDTEVWSRVTLTDEYGEQWQTTVQGDNDFTFSPAVPDGKYTLSFNYENDIYPVQNAVATVLVENRQFVKDDYFHFESKIDIPVDKVWTVTVNREFKPEEVVKAVVKKGTTVHDTWIEQKNEAKQLLIHPLTPYEYGEHYVIEIQLYNGKKYRMRFNTVTK